MVKLKEAWKLYERNLEKIGGLPGAPAQSSPPSTEYEAAVQKLQKLVEQRDELMTLIRSWLEIVSYCCDRSVQPDIHWSFKLYIETYESQKYPLERAIMALTKPYELSQQLCKEMQARLPLELRELIYSYICVSAEPVQIGKRNKSGFSGTFDDYDTAMRRFNKSIKHAHYKHAHYFDADCVGETTLKEILAVYYSRNTFYLANSYHLRVFLETTLINPGHTFHSLYQPTTAVTKSQIRHLIVEVRCDAYYYINESVSKIYVQGLALCATLEPLLFIEKPYRFDLTIMVSARKVKQVYDFLKAFRTLYRCLSNKGVVIRMQCRKNERLDYPEELDRFFGMRKKEWKRFVENYRRVVVE